MGTSWGGRGVHRRGDSGAQEERYARLEMASHTATDSARAPARNELLVDAAIAVAVFAASLGLLAVGES
jgi:hypothetical protein